jgi:NitT/TauT family transport system permease protein
VRLPAPKTICFWGIFLNQRNWPSKPTDPPARRPIIFNYSGCAWGLLSMLLALGIWQAVASFGGLPSFMLPSPEQVAARFGKALSDGMLLRHSAVTILEVLLGLTAGSLLATLLGYGLAKSRALERLLSPYLVASQAIPIVAIAPLLVIWFGPGMFSKVLICALIVFFPVLVNTVVGLRAVPANLRDLEIPAALPVFLGGLRIGATLSVIGAVIGEFVGADSGLGFLINVSRGTYDTALTFVAVFTLVVMALGLYGSVLLLEKLSLKWQSER